MRKLSCNTWLLGAALIGAPAGAQTVSSLTLSTDALVGGASCTGQIVLSGAAGADGVTCSLFTSAPTAVILPTQIVVPPGATEATFNVHTLPIDAPLATQVGARLGDTTIREPLTLREGNRFRTRLALYRPD